jgi:cytochrome c
MRPLLTILTAALAVAVLTAQPETKPHAQELFERRCTGCHALDRDKEGPRLAGVYGRVSGSVPSFNYSDAVKNAHITWDANSLDKWLAGPDQLIPDNDMAFHVESAAERSEIIAYLKQMR